MTPTTTPQSQKGSRSKHAEQEVSSSWAGAEDLKKVEEELDASMDPSSGSSRWKPSSSSSSSQAQGQYEDAGQKAAALAQMSQTGSWRRGMTAQVGITPPRTKGTSAALKTPGRRCNTCFHLGHLMRGGVDWITPECNCLRLKQAASLKKTSLHFQFSTVMEGLTQQLTNLPKET